MQIDKLQNQINQINQDYDFILHYRTESWGSEIYVMESNGKGMVRFYWFNTDKSSTYIEGLSVSENERENGLGSLLMVICDTISQNVGAFLQFLWVERETWMHDWYERLGYENNADHEEMENHVWMVKTLIYGE